jgi:hypothetical protein
MILTSKQTSDFLLKKYEALVPQNSWGEISFFYNPGLKLARGTYFATIKEKDGQNDKASNLNRDRVFRLNFGTDKDTFEKLFGQKPSRPSKSDIIKGDYNFTKLDELMPHPVYGWMGWVCVLNPSQKSLEFILPLLDNCYQITKKRFKKRILQEKID